MHHDPEAAIATARPTIGERALRQASVYLHRTRLNVETQRMVPLELPGRLRRLTGRETSRP